jgi:hypothetical protein
MIRKPVTKVRMEPKQLISIAIFTVISVLTIYAWIDRYRGTNAQINEAFENEKDILNDDTINTLIKANEPEPNDQDAIAAHQTLLRYIRNDFTKGIKFVMDFGQRFYGDNLPLRPDLDVRRLMDNYSSPLQVA